MSEEKNCETCKWFSSFIGGCADSSKEKLCSENSIWEEEERTDRKTCDNCGWHISSKGCTLDDKCSNDYDKWKPIKGSVEEHLSKPTPEEVKEMEEEKEYVLSISGHETQEVLSSDQIEGLRKYFFEKSNKKDNVNHPTHYTQGKIEVIEVIEDWDLNYLEGNIIKYVARYKHKNGKEDLEKARFYLNRLIDGLHNK